MRVYRRAEFMKLPEGTIYARGKKWHFDTFSIKGSTFGNDWAVWSPMWVKSDDSGEAMHRLEEMLETGVSYPMETDYGRDGRFDDEDLFLVLEVGDLIDLEAAVSRAISAASDNG